MKFGAGAHGWLFESHGGDLLLQPCPVWPTASLGVFVSVAKSTDGGIPLTRGGHEEVAVSRPRHYHAGMGASVMGEMPIDTLASQRILHYCPLWAAACYRRQSHCSRGW